MPTITVSDATFEKIKSHAEPLVDDADSVISRLCDFYAAHKALNGNGHAAAKQNTIPLPVGSDKLKHTRLLSAAVDGVELHHADWNSLMRHMHVMAKKRLGSFEAVRKATSANLRQGYFEENGYRYLSEVDFSIQGCDANKSCESAFRLAKAMNIPLRVTFCWREKEEAAYPGQTGVIEWSPEGK
ncbi:MAG TPA: hypothetical protein PL064_01910 [Thermogutta sp.]|nr:hypothetical protein [Thermogutta sp.]